MSLTRLHDPLSLALVRRLGDAGGPRADQVSAELDSLIAWAKDAPRCIHRDFSTVGNVGLGADDLHTYTLPANSLATNGDYLTLDYGGQFAANDNDKRVAFLVDGNVTEDGLGTPQDLDGGANNGWRFLNKIMRVDSTHVRVFTFFAAQFIFMNSAGTVSAPGTAGYIQLNRDFLLTVSDLNSNAIILKCVGETSANVNNDVLQHMSVIELCQQ